MLRVAGTLCRVRLQLARVRFRLFIGIGIITGVQIDNLPSGRGAMTLSISTDSEASFGQLCKKKKITVNASLNLSTTCI